ncbi:hypothetical protein D0T49_03105 [Paludibacter sp. 221]|uniref:glycosyltransferase family protein n=1 Tax=Paludibacter sp. 221 TaxID=2302939 RepID=UPI0013D211D9|nr:glycosyltransferase [Paludibacter sp. 221]NDV46028.1 hypothetical protein [Paludibacter sp. 221]
MVRKIKIYKAFPAYLEYLNLFYSKNIDLNKQSYIYQKSKLIDDNFPWLFSWEVNNIDENVEIFETIHNCESLQKAWLTENTDIKDWQFEIVCEQIKKIQPDICVIYPPELFDLKKTEVIRGLVRHDILIGGYDGMNRKNIELYGGYDFVITCSDYISEYYRKKGMLSYVLNFAFDERVLNKIRTDTPPYFDVGFSGSIYKSIHDTRYTLLKEITKSAKVEIRSDFHVNLYTKRQLRQLVKKRNFDDFLGQWRINKYNKGPVFGQDMYQFLRDSKISLNMHGDKITFAANVRLYEITGVGSCMLTDWKENITNIFIPDKEIITYSSVEEAVDKIVFFKKNDRLRKKIATAGQHRTLNEYTYKKVIPSLINYLKKLL